MYFNYFKESHHVQTDLIKDSNFIQCYEPQTEFLQTTTKLTKIQRARGREKDKVGGRKLEGQKNSYLIRNTTEEQSVYLFTVQPKKLTF